MDTVNPVISKITPLDGTITSVVNPAVTFDVTDTSSGIGSNPSNAIALEIDGIAAGSKLAGLARTQASCGKQRWRP